MTAQRDPVEVGAFEAKNRLSELLREAEAGRSVVITRRGRAVARLVPVTDDDRCSARELRARFRALRSQIHGPVDVKGLVEEGRRW